MSVAGPSSEPESRLDEKKHLSLRRLEWRKICISMLRTMARAGWGRGGVGLTSSLLEFGGLGGVVCLVGGPVIGWIGANAQANAT